jgi:hypothetical protein
MFALLVERNPKRPLPLSDFLQQNLLPNYEDFKMKNLR